MPSGKARRLAAWVPAALIATAAALFGLGACNLIVGSYKTANDAGATADTGPLPDASPGSEAGGADVAMSDDTGVHDGGGDGRVGDGACGSGWSPPAQFQQTLQTCVLAVSCDPNDFGASISSCVSEDYLNSVSAQACLTHITDCKDFAACTGYAIADLSQCPQDSDGGAMCDGNNDAINCLSGGGGSVRSCNKLGGTCGTYAASTGEYADCVVDPSCSQTDGNQYCTSGGALYTCEDGEGYGIICSNIAASCIANTTDGTSCYYNGPSCKTPGFTCSDNAVNWCTDEDIVLNFNCAAAGLTCVAGASDTAECVAPGCTAASIADCVESCTGSVMHLCVGGAKTTFDCSSLASFTSCTTYMTSAGQTRAYCY